MFQCWKEVTRKIKLGLGAKTMPFSTQQSARGRELCEPPGGGGAPARLEESIPGRRNCRCKGPEAGVHMAKSPRRNAASVATVAQAERGRRGRHGPCWPREDRVFTLLENAERCVARTDSCFSRPTGAEHRADRWVGQRGGRGRCCNNAARDAGGWGRGRWGGGCTGNGRSRGLLTGRMRGVRGSEDRSVAPRLLA